jgi:homoserine kinase
MTMTMMTRITKTKMIKSATTMTTRARMMMKMAEMTRLEKTMLKNSPAALGSSLAVAVALVVAAAEAVAGAGAGAVVRRFWAAVGRTGGVAASAAGPG